MNGAENSILKISRMREGLSLFELRRLQDKKSGHEIQYLCSTVWREVGDMEHFVLDNNERADMFVLQPAMSFSPLLSCS